MVTKGVAFSASGSYLGLVRIVVGRLLFSSCFGSYRWTGVAPSQTRRQSVSSSCFGRSLSGDPPIWFMKFALNTVAVGGYKSSID